jgi:hypothetical protein
MIDWQQKFGFSETECGSLGIAKLALPIDTSDKASFVIPLQKS